MVKVKEYFDLVLFTTTDSPAIIISKVTGTELGAELERVQPVFSGTGFVFGLMVTAFLPPPKVSEVKVPPL